MIQENSVSSVSCALEAQSKDQKELVTETKGKKVVDKILGTKGKK